MNTLIKMFILSLMGLLLVSCGSGGDNEGSNEADQANMIQPMSGIITKGTPFSIINTFQRVSDFPEEFVFRNTDDTPNLKVVDGMDIKFFVYEIDVEESSISFYIPEDAQQAKGAPPFRTIEAGTFDRYYFSFNPAQNISSASVEQDGVDVQVIENNQLVPGAELVITISEGFSFNPGTTFTVYLD